MPYRREPKLTGLTMSRRIVQVMTYFILDFSVTLSGFIMFSSFFQLCVTKGIYTPSYTLCTYIHLQTQMFKH